MPPTQQKQSDGMIESADSNLQTFLFTGYRKKNFRFFFSVRGQDFGKRTVNEVGCFLDPIEFPDQFKNDFNVYVIKKRKKCPGNKIM